MAPLREFAKRWKASDLPRGFRGSGVTCGIKRSGKPDLALVVSDQPSALAVSLTKNQFAAPPIHVTREHARGGRARAVIVDSGNANAATGKRGLADARTMCAEVAVGLGLRSRDVLVNSTGVIGVPLPMEKVSAGIPDLVSRLSPAGLNDAAQAIMTTDVLPKRTQRSWKHGKHEIRLVVMAKGVGMIHPNMATMICLALTDARASAPALRRALREATDASFNCLTVDGDTSTNDMVAVLANGASGAPLIDRVSSPGFRSLADALRGCFIEMVRAIASDGEGASRLAVITVRGARTVEEARTVAHSVGTSSLFKCALHGGDPNWGRITMAIGNAPVEIDPDRVSIRMAGETLLRRGVPVKFDVRRAAKGMRANEVPVEIDLGLGKASITCWSSALTEEYVRFNSAYTT
jgi:glutamate N-acetyltransferase/amino-acid N-acetyltransferase